MNRTALDELKKDILARGLLHAPIVRIENSIPILVAGERRLTALREIAETSGDQKNIIYDGGPIPVGQVPTILLNSADEVAHREAELAENILREDLSWQDRVAAVDELHRLRAAQNPEQTKVETAREIAQARQVEVKSAERIVDRATIIAQHLGDPDVARAKSEKEAFKIVAQKAEAAFRAGLAMDMPSEHSLIEGDFTKTILATDYSCVIADPPYGMGADQFGDAAKLAHHYIDDPVEARKFWKLILERSYKHTLAEAHIYMFCDIEFFFELRDHAVLAGWTPYRVPIIWAKGSQGHVPDGSTGFRRTYECILFAAKGGKKLPTIANDVQTVSPASDKLHAAQKPKELYRRLLSFSCLPGDRVLDPCCGSGTIFPAAHELKLKATGVEINAEYVKLARSEIAALNLGTNVSSL